MGGDPFLRKLERAGNLSEGERTALQTLTFNRRSVPARRDITDGDTTDRIYLVMSGFACRYKTLLGGNRRIVSFVLPGDLCYLHDKGGVTSGQQSAKDRPFKLRSAFCLFDIPPHCGKLPAGTGMRGSCEPCRRAAFFADAATLVSLPIGEAQAGRATELSKGMFPCSAVEPSSRAAPPWEARPR